MIFSATCKIINFNDFLLSYYNYVVGDLYLLSILLKQRTRYIIADDTVYGDFSGSLGLNAIAALFVVATHYTGYFLVHDVVCITLQP